MTLENTGWLGSPPPLLRESTQLDLYRVCCPKASSRQDGTPTHKQHLKLFTVCSSKQRSDCDIAERTKFMLIWDCFVCFKNTPSCCVALRCASSRDGASGGGSGLRRRDHVNVSHIPTGIGEKFGGRFPERPKFGEVKGHCSWTMMPAQRLLTGRGQGHCGKGAQWLLLPVMAGGDLHELPITPGRNVAGSAGLGRRS